MTSRGAGGRLCRDVLFALALHIFDVLPSFVLGFWYLKVEKLSLSQIREQEENTTLMAQIEGEEAMNAKPKR